MLHAIFHSTKASALIIYCFNATIDAYHPPRLIITKFSTRLIKLHSRAYYLEAMAQVGQGRGSAALRRVSSGSGPNSGKSQTGRIDIPTSLDQLKEYLYSLTLDNFGKFGEKFGQMTRGYLTSRPNEVNAVASTILEAATNSKETTKLGAMVCKVVIYPASSSEDQEGVSKAFRNKIVELLHTKYKDKKQIRKKSIESWLAVFSMLCDLYHHLHLPSGKSWGFIGKIVLEACKFMFDNDDCDDDEIECISLHLKNNGQMLEEEHSLGVECIVSELRTRVISKKTTERVRCLCMDLIEYRARGYCDPDNKLSDYYLVALQDAIANDETQY